MDSDFTKTLIEINHPDKSGEELLRKYYGGGVDTVANDIDSKDYFDYEQYL